MNRLLVLGLTLSVPVLAETPASPAQGQRRAQLPAGYVEVDGIAAVVGDQIIGMGELRRAEGSQAASQSFLPTEADRPRSEAALRRQTLDSLVDNALVLRAAKDLGLSVEEREVDAQIEGTKKKNRWSDDDLQEAVGRIGFATVQAYRSHVRNELMRMQMLRYKVGSKMRVAEDDVKRVLAQEHGGGQWEDELRGRHILVSVPPSASPPEVAQLRAKAWACWDQLSKGGKPWDEVESSCSDERGAGPGGDIGWQRRWTLEPTFAGKLWSLKKGETSSVIQTPFGFHIIQLLDRRRAEVKDKELLEEYVRRRLSEDQFVRLYRAWIEELRASTHIDVRI